MSAFKNKSIMISIPEFMNTCDLDRNTMYKYLKEGIPYERINHTKGIVIDFEKAKKWIIEREHEKENKNKRVLYFIKIFENKIAIIIITLFLITVVNFSIIISLAYKCNLYKNAMEGLQDENESLRDENIRLINLSEKYPQKDFNEMNERTTESLKKLNELYPNVPTPAISLLEIIDTLSIYGNFILIQAEKDKEEIGEYLLRESFTPRGWPVEGEITSYFGQRYCERGSVLSRTLGYIGWKYHSGIDIAAPILTPVCATADGIVIFVGMKSSYGNLIIIEHGGVYRTLYGHLSHFTIENGKEVKRGDLIGGIGKTGRVTGPHLHYEVHVLDDSGKGLAVNPLPYVKN